MKRETLSVGITRRSSALVLLLGLSLLLATTALQAAPVGDDNDESFLGVIMQSLSSDIIKGMDLQVKSGILIADVIDDSPADEAGIEEGDVVIEFDGKKVRDPGELKDMVANSKVGDKVKIKLIRDNKKKVITVTIGERPEEEEGHYFRIPEIPQMKKSFMCLLNPSRRLGVTVAELNDDLAGYFDVHEGEGVLVLEVEKKSAAEDAGIKPGDVIVKVGDEKITSVDRLKDAVKDLDADEDFGILAIRHGKKLKVKARIEEAKKYEKYYLKSMKRKRLPRYEYKIETDEVHKELKELKKEVERLRKEIDKLKQR